MSFKADETGYAPAVKGQTEVDKRYVFGVGVALTKANSSAEMKLISRAGQTIKSLVLSSSTPVFWQAPLGEFISGTDDFPNRIEMKVLTGTAQGFLSIEDVESGEVTPLPIAPFVRQGSLTDHEGAMVEEESSLAAQSATGGPMLGEESSAPAQSSSGGFAYFTNGVYDSRFTSYKYKVYGAPPDVCGTLHIKRNGINETAPGWICTNASGLGEKGPWTGSTNQTCEDIYIQWPWPYLTTTTGGNYKVDDGSDPSIWSYQMPGIGVPIPAQFNGAGSDVQWGTGFHFGIWSSITGRFRQEKPDGTSKYYDGYGYFSASPVYHPGSASPTVGFSISWSVNSPPPGVHNSTDKYEWCVYSNDYFYPCFNCIYFHGPR